MSEPIPDGNSPFEGHECGHLACPDWMRDDERSVVLDERAPAGEPELDPPHHVHDLWIALGLGEE